jgi:hypothetical protein
MTDTEIREVQTLGRMNDFGKSKATDFPASSLGGQKFAEAQTLVDELDELGEAQARASGEAQARAERKKNARVSLLKMLRAIRETAKAIDADKPGTSDLFKVPTTNGDEALVNSARASFANATLLKADFVQREMPATFLEDLSAIIDAFESANSSLNLHTGNRVSATAGIKTRLARAKNLRKELHPIVTNKYRNDHSALAAWKSASHVERPPRHATKKSTTKG